MSSYEKYDLFLTGLNFLFLILSFIVGLFIDKNKRQINNDKKDIKEISKEIKKYRNTIINNRDLSNLTIVLEEVKDINKKLDNIIYKEKQNDTRGTDIFKEYFNGSQKIFDIKSKIPSKYQKLEEELDEVRTILNDHISSKSQLSKSKQCDNIDLLFNNIIVKLKKYIENLNVK